MVSSAILYLHFVNGSRDLLFEFWDSLYISERLELETSNLACILTNRGTNEKNAKLG